MSYGSPPAAGYQQQPYGPPPPQHGSAVTALVLGIVSLAFCSLLGIPAYIIGRRTEAEIRASNGALSGEGMAKAGWICGLVAMILLGLTLLVFLLVIAGGGLMALSSP